MSIVCARVSASDEFKVRVSEASGNRDTDDGGLVHRQSAQFQVNRTFEIMYLLQPEEQGWK